MLICGLSCSPLAPGDWVAAESFNRLHEALKWREAIGPGGYSARVMPRLVPVIRALYVMPDGWEKPAEITWLEAADVIAQEGLYMNTCVEPGVVET